MLCHYDAVHECVYYQWRGVKELFFARTSNSLKVSINRHQSFLKPCPEFKLRVAHIIENVSF